MALNFSHILFGFKLVSATIPGCIDISGLRSVFRTVLLINQEYILKATETPVFYLCSCATGGFKFHAMALCKRAQ